MRKIIVICITFYAINWPTGSGGKNSCPGEEEKCQPVFTDLYMNSDITEIQGGSHTFYCYAKGNPTPNFTWMKNGINLNISNDFLEKKNLQPRDSGNYSCHVWNEKGHINFTYVLKVTNEIRLENGTAHIGKPYTFLCHSQKPSNESSFDVYWFHSITEEKIIPDSCNISNLKSKMLSRYNSNFTINSVSKKDEGLYMCMKKYANEECEWSNNAYLKVEPDNSDSFFGTFLISSCILIAMMIVCGVPLYYYKYKKIPPSTPDGEKMQGVVKRITVLETPDNPEKLDLRIEYYNAPLQRSDDESENELRRLRYAVRLDGIDIPKIPRVKVRLDKYIASGAYGIVHLAFLEQEPNVSRKIVVKMLRDNHNDNAILDSVSEMKIMTTIGEHDNIINLIGCCCEDNYPLWTLMEHAGLGDLKKFLEERKNREFDEQTLLRYARQIAEGMKFLASKNVIHRDLAARNVLVTEDYVIKISDFGLARRYIHENGYYHIINNKNKLPVKWMAPESIFDGLYTTKSDVWSFGIVLWEMMSLGDEPHYRSKSNKLVGEDIKNGFRLGRPNNCSEETHCLMRRCWEYEAEKRPTFSETADELDRIIESFDEGSVRLLERPTTPSEGVNSSISLHYVESFH